MEVRHTLKMNKSLIVILLTCFAVLHTTAQNTMRIHYKSGDVEDIFVERVDSITFLDKNQDQQEVSLVGEWLWGSKEKGYYEVLTFNEDKTYTGYDYYLEYGFDTRTYGTYMANGVMLNLWSNGYGYCRVYRWFVTGLTANALEVMTQMGTFVYYRLQDEEIHLKVGGDPMICEDGDRFVFADGVNVAIEDGKLYAKKEGTTYIQFYQGKTGLILAYKVFVSY